MKYERVTKRQGTEVIALTWDGEILHRLAELEDKIENGTLVDITEKFIIEEEIKNKTRYLICEYYLTKMAVDFADNKAEAEAKLKELREKDNEREVFTK